MTDRELQYVLAIAQNHNITHAAEQLHIAQPSLTQSLRRIEAELGCTLFKRRKYGLDLTAEGELYCQMARDILARMKSFKDELEKTQGRLTGQFVMGASWYNTLLFLSDLVSDLNEKYPNVELSLIEKGTSELLKLLLSHEISVALAHEYPKEYPGVKKTYAKDVHRVKLMDERFLLVAHRKYELAKIAEGSCVDIRRLSDAPFISFNANQRIRNITDYAFERAGVVTRKVVKTQSFPGAMDFAERGIGIAVLPSHYVYRNINSMPSLECFGIDVHWHAYWSAYVYYREEEYSLPLIKSVLSILHREADQFKKEAESRSKVCAEG